MLDDAVVLVIDPLAEAVPLAMSMRSRSLKAW